MGYVIERCNSHGKIRYTAMYRDIKGKLRSAGTFGAERQAERAWQRAESNLAIRKIGDPKRGRQTLRRYVEEEWFPNHVIEATTREGYTYMLRRYILPELGPMCMVEIMPHHIREWVVTLQTKYKAKSPTIQKCKVVVDAILTTAFNDQITFLHAGKGVKTPTVATKARRIITVEQFDRMYAAFADPVWRLLVETDIESGLRWGELTELRPKDIDFSTGMLTVARVVVHLRAGDRPDGVDFVVKNYPKDKEWRQLRLASHLLDKIKDFMATQGLGPDDLLFAYRPPTTTRHRTLPHELPDPDTLGFTEPNELGRRYQHGTPTAYNAGRCRCVHCKNAINAYRARRRAAGKDGPRQPRTVTTDGHISNAWFRVNVWAKAEKGAELGFHVTPHVLRHAHASWLLAGGADINVVQKRLGHGSITTTAKYLHTLPGSDDAALDALATIRGRTPETPETAARPSDRPQPTLDEVMAMMAQIKDMYDQTSGGGTSG